MEKLKEIMVESILDLKTSMSSDSKGAHQVINWTKHNSIHNVLKLKNINISLQQQSLNSVLQSK